MATSPRAVSLRWVQFQCEQIRSAWHYGIAGMGATRRWKGPDQTDDRLSFLHLDAFADRYLREVAVSPLVLGRVRSWGPVGDGYANPGLGLSWAAEVRNLGLSLHYPSMEDMIFQALLLIHCREDGSSHRRRHPLGEERSVHVEYDVVLVQRFKSVSTFAFFPYISLHSGTSSRTAPQRVKVAFKRLVNVQMHRRIQ